MSDVANVPSRIFSGQDDGGRQVILFPPGSESTVVPLDQVPENFDGRIVRYSEGVMPRLNRGFGIVVKGELVAEVPVVVDGTYLHDMRSSANEYDAVVVAAERALGRTGLNLINF